MCSIIFTNLVQMFESFGPDAGVCVRHVVVTHTPCELSLHSLALLLASQHLLGIGLGLGDGGGRRCCTGCTSIEATVSKPLAGIVRKQRGSAIGLNAFPPPTKSTCQNIPRHTKDNHAQFVARRTCHPCATVNRIQNKDPNGLFRSTK